MSGDTFSTVLMLVVVIAAFYFLLIRPAQKKQREQQDMVSKLAPGVRIMTTAGIFGTIRHIGQAQVIIETAPGVEMTLAKQAVLRTATAAEDEFEYDDEPEDERAFEDDPTDEAQVTDDTGAGDDTPQR